VSYEGDELRRILLALGVCAASNGDAGGGEEEKSTIRVRVRARPFFDDNPYRSFRSLFRISFLAVYFPYEQLVLQRWTFLKCGAAGAPGAGGGGAGFIEA